MYYLSKFCRICIQTDEKLLDIDSDDYDCIKLSEKLAICTKMVINKESLSTQICMSCVQKLRVSYEFQNMCKQSSKILQGYLAELLSATDKISPDQFVNSDLCVTLQPITRLQHQRKKRVSKEQRCSLLKKLLLKTKGEKYVKEESNGLNNIAVTYQKKVIENHRGGLRDLIHFTRNFDFGFKVDSYQNYDNSPLERLTDFSRNFFYSDFSDFRSTILYIIENEELTEDSEEEEMIRVLETSSNDCICSERGNSDITPLKFEEVIVEPDIKIKKEYEFECEDEENFESTYDFSSSFVEVCYDSESNGKIKTESSECVDSLDQNSFVPQSTFVGHNKFLAEIIPIVSQDSSLPMPPDSYRTTSESSSNLLSNKYKTLCSVLNSPLNHSPPATELLGQFVAQFTHHSRRTLSPHSIRCRTRGNPYINPQLQKQFQLRSFKCNTCNRRFKSPGYLNAHIVKLRH